MSHQLRSPTINTRQDVLVGQLVIQEQARIYIPPPVNLISLRSPEPTIPKRPEGRLTEIIRDLKPDRTLVLLPDGPRGVVIE